MKFKINNSKEFISHPIFQKIEYNDIYKKINFYLKKIKTIQEYSSPDFSEENLKNVPNSKIIKYEKDGVLPLNYHSTRIFPRIIQNKCWMDFSKRE